MTPKSNFDLEKIFGKKVDVVDNIIKEKHLHLRKMQIPKKDGSTRHIVAPDKDLKYIQKGLYWRLLSKYKPSPAAHGFVKRRGIKTNAIPHIGSASMGKIDIKSFFDTISEKHLQNCLFGNKNVCRLCKNHERMMHGLCNPSLYHNKTKKFKFTCEEIKAVFIPDYCEKTGYQSLFKRVIELCTINGFTAQGFPTSPVLANIVMRGFDIKMLEHCSQHDIVYTRYADDMAFSSKTLNKHQLKAIVQTKVMQLLWAFGFKANKKKTTWKSKAGSMRICGIVTNVKASIPRKNLKLFRSQVHHAIVKDTEKTTKPLIRSLKGMASYIMSVDHDKGKKYMNQLLTFEKTMAA